MANTGRRNEDDRVFSSSDTFRKRYASGGETLEEKRERTLHRLVMARRTRQLYGKNKR